MKLCCSLLNHLQSWIGGRCHTHIYIYIYADKHYKPNISPTWKISHLHAADFFVRSGSFVDFSQRSCELWHFVRLWCGWFRSCVAEQLADAAMRHGLHGAEASFNHLQVSWVFSSENWGTSESRFFHFRLSTDGVCCWCVHV